MAANTKERSDAIQAAARALLLEQQIDITKQIPVRDLAKLLAEQTECHYDTAKRHIVQAARIARGEHSRGEWGGARPGAGNPNWIKADDNH